MIDLAHVRYDDVKDGALWAAICAEADRLLALPVPPRRPFRRRFDSTLAVDELDSGAVINALLIWAEQDMLRRSPAGRLPDVDEKVEHHTGGGTWHGGWVTYSPAGVTLENRARDQRRTWTWKKLRAAVAAWRAGDAQQALCRDLDEAERLLADYAHELADMRARAVELGRQHFLGETGFRNDVCHRAARLAGAHQEVERLRALQQSGEIQLGLFAAA